MGENISQNQIFETVEREREGERERERERERGGNSFSFGDFSGFVGQKSSRPELKVFVSTRATRRHQKVGFHRRSTGGDLEKSRASSLRSVLRLPAASIMLQEVGILPTLVLFLLLG